MRAVLEVEPCAHSWQWCDPVAAAIDPAGQCTQRNVPGRDLAWPGRQCRSVVSPPLSTTISTPALGTATGKGLNRVAYASKHALSQRRAVRLMRVAACRHA